MYPVTSRYLLVTDAVLPPVQPADGHGQPHREPAGPGRGGRRDTGSQNHPMVQRKHRGCRQF